jgi:hypothetical protein
MFSMSKANDRDRHENKGDHDELPQDRPGQEDPQARCSGAEEGPQARAEEARSEAAPDFS